MLIFMPPRRPYTSVNLKEIQINGFTGPHLLNLWDFTLMEISTGGGGGGHVHHVIKNVSSGIAILKSSRNFLPQRTLNILYRSLIETQFCYGNIVWYVKGTSQTVSRFRLK